MIILGLTGSIGMGKSTTAAMFSELGIPVHGSDETVHRLYSGRAAPLVEAEFRGTVIDGVVDREKLAKAVLADSAALRRLEAIVHPLVREEEILFLDRHRKAGAPLVVLDIPLLFETGGNERVDKIVVVTAPPEVQRERVLRRPGMTEDKFAAILAKQVPDAQKRQQADFIIDTGAGMDAARREVEKIVSDLTG